MQKEGAGTDEERKMRKKSEEATALILLMFLPKSFRLALSYSSLVCDCDYGANEEEAALSELAWANGGPEEYLKEEPYTAEEIEEVTGEKLTSFLNNKLQSNISYIRFRIIMMG
ncbi:hypothetical protein E2542_SST18287 [Spatholobus suberectus]|nr:hypothetical protein E2542_SST18287 [Spatholobus suberectus]